MKKVQKRLLSKVLTAGLLFSAATGLRAQAPEDPLTVKPIERNTAGFSTPWGIVATSRILFKVSDYSDEQTPESYTTEMRSNNRFGLSAYYDAWQIGFNYKEYGNTITLLSRTVGRDSYRGWGIEIGQSTNKRVYVTDLTSKTEIKTDTYNPMLYGFTYGGRTGLGSSWEFSFLYDVAAGIVKGEPGSVSENEYEISPSGTGIYASIDLGIGARIPISESAVTVNLVGNFLMAPPSTLYIENGSTMNNFSSERIHLTTGLGVNLAYALNFYK